MTRKMDTACLEPWCHVLENMLRHGDVEIIRLPDKDGKRMCQVRWQCNATGEVAVGTRHKLADAVKVAFERREGDE